MPNYIIKCVNMWISGKTSYNIYFLIYLIEYMIDSIYHEVVKCTNKQLNVQISNYK